MFLNTPCVESFVNTLKLIKTGVIADRASLDEISSWSVILGEESCTYLSGFLCLISLD